MHIDPNFIPIFAISVGLIITVTAILTDSITKYKLKVEQIRADALVRSEEVRTKNQLELEKLLRQESTTSSDYGNANGDEKNEDYVDSRKAKNRIRD